MTPLIALALKSGLPFIEKLLSGKIGDQNGQLTSAVVQAIADRIGVPPAELPKAMEEMPGRVIEAMRAVETAAPEMIAAYDRDLQLQLATLAAEQDEPTWMRAWRPAGMYLLGFLWLWNTVLLHIANAIWKTALPPMPFSDLIQLSGLYMALYMGGHTVKDVVKTWVAK
ncbi:MAG: hypothetical protein JWS10_949 [Cypionkella sp.]|uniref:hypothetical protein n=1 Tax=Cypionkella sp. TaxID=2811411 RepID=UPI00260EDFA0|nr:hypothetical protein [Cypionkella sp.]MDB5658334.1 hypothetical protein [Cypionkella sp.]